MIKRKAHPKTDPPGAKSGTSKTRLVVGAAGLLLFILGVRRTFQSDGGTDSAAALPNPDHAATATDKESSAAPSANQAS